MLSDVGDGLQGRQEDEPGIEAGGQGGPTGREAPERESSAEAPAKASSQRHKVRFSDQVNEAVENLAQIEEEVEIVKEKLCIVME